MFSRVINQELGCPNISSCILSHQLTVRSKTIILFLLPLVYGPFYRPIGFFGRNEGDLGYRNPVRASAPRVGKWRTGKLRNKQPGLIIPITDRAQI